MVSRFVAAGVRRGTGPLVLRQRGDDNDDDRRRSVGETASEPLQAVGARTGETTEAVLLVVAFGAAANGDRASARAGHCVPVAATERLLPGDILRGARHPVGGRHGRGWTVLRHGHDGDVGHGPVADQRCGVRVVPARRTPAAVDRVVVGYGVFGRSGGADLHRWPRPTAIGAAVAVDWPHGVRVQRLGRCARVPVDAGRRTVARLGSGRGRRPARRLRVHAHVRRAQSVPVRGGR